MNILLVVVLLSLVASSASFGQAKQPDMPPVVKLILNETKPLKFPRNHRLPLYVWAVTDMVGKDDRETERIIRELDARGIAFVSTWDYNRKWESLDRARRVARIQKRLGLEVSINANPCMYSFFDGDPRTAHITSDDKLFFDSSFGQPTMGCPFTVRLRYPEMKKRFEFFTRAFKAEHLPVNFVVTDWEIDGPIEWNGAWEASKRCRRCREHIKNIDDFAEFQSALRTIRSEMQKEVYADTIRSFFPKVLVGNYGVYPNDGYRYWYDYYEQPIQKGMPYRADQDAKYRRWFQEFPLTGYTFAMPVIYTWYQIFDWYNYRNPDYRWFYNLLLNATNACKSTPSQVPVISFVHWHTTSPSTKPDPKVKQFSEEKYRELLWHMLLRGTDGFYLWCPTEEIAEEVRVLHEVYSESLEYADFLNGGTPICFDVPREEGPVLSGLKLGNKVLIRRTDFDDTTVTVEVRMDGKRVLVPRIEGKCQVIDYK